MDYILKRIENNLLFLEPGEYDYITCLRTRIEYSLFLCLGYAWKNIGEIEQEKRVKIFNDLSNISIGSVVSAIRELDRSKHEIIPKKKFKIIDTYPAIRNSKIGHGYKMADSVASSLEPLYNELIEAIPLLQEDCDLIVVLRYDDLTQMYKGIRFPAEKNGQGEHWSCPKELIENDMSEFPRTFISYKDTYVKISPFIYIDWKTRTPFVFSSLIEKVNGKTKLCPLFPSHHEDDDTFILFRELISLSFTEGSRKFSQLNGMIMNNFKLNYSQYIDVGFQDYVNRFLHQNRAYVTATIWGHGGVGKTACIQRICEDLFNSTEKTFSYIIFVTAKDRIYNPRTGEINNASGNIRSYNEVIQSIVQVLLDCIWDYNAEPDRLEEYENIICQSKEKFLIIIDDYETFEDSEKEKIANFLSRLDASRHKAIITTRNNRFVIGEPIPCNELDIIKTKKFIESVISAQYPEHLQGMSKFLSNSTTLKNIFEATSGRPIFIYQFIYLYVRKGYRSNLISEICESENAREFLYGRIFDYLSKNSKMIFATISILVDNDLRFNLQVLEHVLSKIIPDKEEFENGLDEIYDQKAIEQINDAYARVYSPELLNIMERQYQQFPQDIRRTIKNLLDAIGGKDIKGGIFEALLEQADKSRTFGNERETIEKYRRVLNSASSVEIKRVAIKHLTDYLSNARLNTLLAISTMEEYLTLFPNDSEIYSAYVYLLWSQDTQEKEKAIKAVHSFFSNSQNKKTDLANLTFFALGTGYFIDYDLTYRTYSNAGTKRIQCARTFNEYGRTLFDFVSSRTIKGKPALFHNIRVALIQTIKICIELGRYERGIEKIKYGLDICDWIDQPNLPSVFKKQILKLRTELEKTSLPESNSVLSSDDILPQIDVFHSSTSDEKDTYLSNGTQYSIGDIVEVTVQDIDPYGVRVSMDEKTLGFIHISDIANRYISNISKEFEIGEKCRARITAVDYRSKRSQFRLSTIGLRF